MFNGLGMNLGTLAKLSDAQSFSISAENFTGAKGKGGMATQGTASDCARELGQGWKVSPSIDVEAGQVTEIADITGSGAIQSMWFAGEISRDFILRIYWEDQENPSVEVPLPDFFAFGWCNDKGGKNNSFPTLNSIPVVVAPNKGLNCFWEMPFKKHCKITLENIGTQKHFCYYQINYTLTEIKEEIAYFHAQFRRSNPVEYMKDHVIVDGIKGQGHYVGTALFVGLNGANGWWGEGEVKMFIDGDTDFPTICGTGTEDYVGGAFDWDVDSKYVPYSTPYMGMYQVLQPDGMYISQQRFAMYRWHIMDPIRFKSDFKMTIQDLGWRDGHRFLPRQDDIASVSYWYQTLPTAKFPKFPSRNDLEII